MPQPVPRPSLLRRLLKRRKHTSAAAHPNADTLLGVSHIYVPDIKAAYEFVVENYRAGDHVL